MGVRLSRELSRIRAKKQIYVGRITPDLHYFEQILLPELEDEYIIFMADGHPFDCFSVHRDDFLYLAAHVDNLRGKHILFNSGLGDTFIYNKDTKERRFIKYHNPLYPELTQPGPAF